MTLLLNAVVKQHAIHASDRLVSLKSESGKDTSVEWDPAANKTLVVVASDAWLIISYTGLAYLDGKPTDQWIAEVITGLDLSTGGIMPWMPPSGFHAQRAAELIRDGATDAYARLDRRARTNPLEIQIVGLQNATPRPAHLLWSVHNGSGVFILDKADLDAFRWDRGYSLLVGGVSDTDEVSALIARLQAEGMRSPEHFCDSLVQCIVKTSPKSYGKVGRDCMTVILKPRANRIQTLYVPDCAKTQSRSALGPDNVPPAYAPWAILPGFIYAPAIIEGHQEWQGTFGLTYVVSGPERRQGTARYASQTRRGAPRRHLPKPPTSHP